MTRLGILSAFPIVVAAASCTVQAGTAGPDDDGDSNTKARVDGGTDTPTPSATIKIWQR
jgi:hypothetical protein